MHIACLEELHMRNRYEDAMMIIKAFEEMASTRIADGWTPYYLSFMFRQLPANKAVKFAIMGDEVTRVYRELLSNVVRRPKSEFLCRYNPVLIGCPDNQVPKRDRNSEAAHINDGWHYNAIIILPPDSHSRFREHLANHIAVN